MSAGATYPNGEPCAPGAHLAEFLERRGKPVIDVDGAYFARIARFSYVRVPPTEPIEPDVVELDAALRRCRAASIQYPTLTHPGAERGGFVCRSAGYSLARVHGKSRRRQVRHGLGVTTVRQLDFAELLELGMELNEETTVRQKRFDPELCTPRGWRRFVAAAEACSRHVAVFGALVDGHLASYCVTCREEATLHLLYRMSRTDDLRQFAAMALDYWLLAEAGKDPTIDVVTNGTVRSSLVTYKTSMGFEIVPFRWASRLHPTLRAIAEMSWCERVTSSLSRRLPNSAYARSIAAAVRTAQHHA